ncbi:class I adenylate-forming enzyme family protein [Actinomadura rugatobispora]|uniref:Class I adenylate-forming enzyme family protein n=1 Tax=Actinomadura rugatobispora TaxID=1994 RepID=A0ABW0ZSG2_9ACTN|nr:AMP-binding protein [Actinomadura rugatobispora]
MSVAESQRPGTESGGPQRVGLLAETVGEALRRQARDHGHRPAVLWEAGEVVRRLTYTELEARAQAVAHLLGGAGLVVEDRVAVWGANCVEWVLLEYACALRGLVLVPLNTAWTDEETAAALDLAEPSMVFTGADGRGAPLRERAERLAGTCPVRPLAGLLECPEASPTRVTVGPDAPFLMQFTSGTTGRAKGALLSHRSVLNAAHLRERRDPASGGVCLNSVPYHHIGGSLYVVLGALTGGGAFVVVDRFDADQTVRLLPLAGVTHLGGVPIMIERVLDRPGLAAAAGSVTTVALGGADISPRLIDRVRDELGATVLTTYGQSECPIITCSTPGDDPVALATTAGRPVEATEVRIIDPRTGGVAGPGETGEILVRSPLVMRGYHRAPQRTAEVLTGDGFLHTGDLGRLDADGNLTIRGRIREVIIRGGENIYPAEVEAALARHPAVTACAVVGVTDPSWGEVVGASVITAGQAVQAAELETFLAERIAHFKVPRRWRFVEELPMTAAGKIRRVQVKQEMNDQDPHDPDTPRDTAERRAR